MHIVNQYLMRDKIATRKEPDTIKQTRESLRVDFANRLAKVTEVIVKMAAEKRGDEILNSLRVAICRNDVHHSAIVRNVNCFNL